MSTQLISYLQDTGFDLYNMREWLSGGAPPCQGGGRGFDPRLALFLCKGISERISLFVYTMSRAQIRACTEICIRRMYIIESIDEMLYRVYIVRSSRLRLGRCIRRHPQDAMHRLAFFSYKGLVPKVQAKPFDTDFDKQIEVCRNLYGQQFYISASCLEQPVLEQIEAVYGEVIRNRMETVYNLSLIHI